MKQGFVKVAAVTPDIRVADVEFNKEQICRKMDEAAASGAKIIVFPELQRSLSTQTATLRLPAHS